MRKKTGKESENDVRRATARLKKVASASRSRRETAACQSDFRSTIARVKSRIA
jgi:hypothetical protein